MIPTALLGPALFSGLSDLTNSGIQRLVQQLGSEKFLEREAAVHKLHAIGDVAQRMVRAAARTSPNAEIRRRASLLCRPTREEKAQEVALQVIITYWRRKYRDVPDRIPSEKDSVQVYVPIAIESRYFYPFSREFLEEQSKSEDSIRRTAAQDLLYLKYPIRERSDPATLIYGISNPGPEVKVIVYTARSVEALLADRDDASDGSFLVSFRKEREKK